MPNQLQQTDARRDFTRRALPWVVAAAMFAVYALTLNHWISVFNIDLVANVSGWSWGPQVFNPVFFLVTLPVRLLPATAVPIALNCVSAVCAAAALGLLARSAALLPHDRTEAQAARLRSDFSLLAFRGSWFPPLLAALVCGLQLTFWQLGTNGGNGIFDLLLLALALWSLLEYRLDEKIWRIYFSSAIVGAGIAEGPSMTACFPLFLAAVIWMRQLNFFNLRFLIRLLLWGLAGFSLFLVLPLTAVISGKATATFWELLRYSLTPQFHVLKTYFMCVAEPAAYFEYVTVPVLICVLPLLVMAVRWKFGDSSHVGSVLASFMFHTIHAIFLCVCLWTAFDPPFSPRERGFGLTLYYLMALSTAYYSGYFLLVFGRKHPRVRKVPSAMTRFFNGLVVATIWVFGILAIAGLVYKNAPLVRAANNNTLHKFATLMANSLPRGGGIVLSDDPRQLYLIEGALADGGRLRNYLPLDTALLRYPQYHRYLHKEAPKRWPLLVGPKENNLLNVLGLVRMMTFLSQSNTLYYLHPSFGYYFEAFYLEPHGMVYRMRPLPNDTLQAPHPDKELIAENQDFWTAAQTDVLSSVESALAPSEAGPLTTFARQQLERLDVPEEPDINAMVVGTYCSRDLDFWGVELQRSGDLNDAAQTFETALSLNTNNVVARINLDYNDELRGGYHPGIDLSQSTSERLGKFDNLIDAMRAGGPFDEPNYCYEYALDLVQNNGFFRQAATPFARICQLDPHFLTARIWLARIYGLNKLPDSMLAVLRAPMEHPRDFSVTEPEATQMEMLSSAAYYQKGEVSRGTRLLEQVAANNPTNDELLATIEEIYSDRGMYTNALVLAENRLSQSPNNPKWLYVKGFLDNRLGRYNDAIAVLEKVLAIHEDSPNTIFQLADAYLANGNLDAARTDYEKLQETHTNSAPVAFNLGEIAWRQHDAPEVIRNYNIYLANAPTNTAAARMVIERLHQLQQTAHNK